MGNDLDAPAINPKLSIIMWSGFLSKIPFGWKLCDGTNNTPDLRARFLRGAPTSTEAGTLGGEDTHVLTTTEIANHTHTFNNPTHTHVGGPGGTGGGD